MINLLPWTSLQLGPFGGMELIIILLVVGVGLFGTKKIPEIARSLGRAKGEFHKGKRELERELKDVDTTSSQEMAAPSAEHQKLLKAAVELSIDVEGKTDDQLRAEIRSAVDK
uniref:Sec-independent protein secretion pathway component n=1 Tax=uncultured marine thaumarchaeote KM3_74_C10 TaxID=1456270 RepID=A0A075HRC0_9ARCH|nr:Sec-independent protein secretion pathway component [uncultured marine thaumarchaeote KM3_74_C10]